MARTTERHDVDVLRQWIDDREWTEASYLEFANDTNRIVELVDGKLVIHPMPTLLHQIIIVNLTVALHASKAGRVFLAALPTKLWSDRIREPDVLFFTTAHFDRLHEAYVDPPDLAVEVLSPDRRSLKRDRVDKRAEYARAGIPEYWIVDPEVRNVLVLRLDAATGTYSEAGRFAGDDVVTALAAPDVAIRVEAMFA